MSSMRTAVVESEARPAAGGPTAGGFGLLTRLALLGAIGVALATLPHAAAFRATGDPDFIADGDELLYRAWSRAAVLDGEPALVDAIHRPSGPMMHPRALFVPPALLANALGLDLTRVALLWRALAGLGVAWGLYAAMRAGVGRPWLAAVAAAALLVDAGFVYGQPGYRPLLIARSLAQGSDTFFNGVPAVMNHLRVVTPALALPVLLVHLGLMVRARARSERWAIVGAGVGLGLLFHLYFYFWTAAMAALALAFVLDAPGRRLYAMVGVTGLLIGLPALYEGYATKARTPPDWLLRTDKFAPLGRFQELLLPASIYAVLAAAGLWAWRSGRRELTYLWCSAVAGAALENHQVVTRLQIENFHYVQALGVSLSVLLGLLAAGWVDARADRLGPAARRGLWGVLALVVLGQVGMGLAGRWLEATRTRETREWAERLARYRADALPIPPGAVLAGDYHYTFLAAALGEVYPLSGRLVEYSSEATDRELDERLVLNFFLEGLSRAEAEAEVRRPAGTLSRESHAKRTPEAARAQEERRLGLVEQIYADPVSWIRRYSPTHILLRRDTGRDPAASLAGLARLQASGSTCDLWALEPPEAARTPHL